MGFTLKDFKETLACVERDYGLRLRIKKVVAAWGVHDVGNIWSGGFLFQLDNDRETWVYITGWCDYTGWGCQDGAEVHAYNSHPILRDLPKWPHTGIDAVVDWEPADLNRYVRGEIA